MDNEASEGQNIQGSVVTKLRVTTFKFTICSSLSATTTSLSSHLFLLVATYSLLLSRLSALDYILRFSFTCVLALRLCILHIYLKKKKQTPAVVMVSWGNCRYYENELPELDQVVMVNIKQVRRKSFRPQGDGLPLFFASDGQS